MIEVGQKAPAFALQNQEGVSVSLADFQGKNLVLYFYPKDDTPGCTREAIGFGALKAAFAEANTVVLGISRDSVDAHKRFCDKHRLEVSLLSDSTGHMTEAYGVWQEKKQYGRTYFGIVRSTYWVGSDGCVQKVWKNVKVEGHPEAVLAAILDKKG